ncbi:tetrahydrofolate dehydrogenase/cyclohydrolase catalytic domain-containing protein, partial [Elusimicrobiota bacterium]
MGEILYGSRLAGELRKNTAEKIKATGRSNRPPCLKVVIAGNDEGSLYYAALIKKAGEEDGIEIELHHIADPDTQKIKGILETANDDTGVDGILIQTPLPGDID